MIWGVSSLPSDALMWPWELRDAPLNSCQPTKDLAQYLQWREEGIRVGDWGT